MERIWVFSKGMPAYTEPVSMELSSTQLILKGLIFAMLSFMGLTWLLQYFGMQTCMEQT